MGPGFKSLKVHQSNKFKHAEEMRVGLLSSPAARVALGPGFKSLKVHQPEVRAPKLRAEHAGDETSSASQSEVKS